MLFYHKLMSGNCRKYDISNRLHSMHHNQWKHKLGYELCGKNRKICKHKAWTSSSLIQHLNSKRKSRLNCPQSKYPSREFKIKEIRILCNFSLRLSSTSKCSFRRCAEVVCSCALLYLVLTKTFKFSLNPWEATSAHGKKREYIYVWRFCCLWNDANKQTCQLNIPTVFRKEIGVKRGVTVE